MATKVTDLKIGDYVKLDRKLESLSGFINEGEVVKIVAIGSRGYDVIAGDGLAVSECGFGIGDIVHIEVEDEDNEYVNSEDQDVDDVHVSSEKLSLSYTAEFFSNFMINYYSSGIHLVQRLGQAFHEAAELDKFKSDPERGICDKIYQADGDTAIKMICLHFTE